MISTKQNRERRGPQTYTRILPVNINAIKTLVDDELGHIRGESLAVSDDGLADNVISPSTPFRPPPTFGHPKKTTLKLSPRHLFLNFLNI